MLFSWLKDRRRRKLLEEPFPPAWQTYFEHNVRHYPLLPSALQDRLRGLTRIFVAEKEWVGCGGLTVSEEMRATVAAEACLLLLGNDGDYCFDGVKTILLYPTAFRLPKGRQGGNWLVDDEQANEGEAWHRGPIVLSWNDALAGARGETDGGNLVIHEFAHHLDGLDGDIGGTPPLDSGDQQARWERVMQREYDQLTLSARRHQPTLLDPYGATNRAEFFAVVSECFFEQPHDLQTEHPELYELLTGFYRLSPIDWK